MRKVVFDVDDTLWLLNKRVASITGIDYGKLTIFSVHDNTNLTDDEKQKMLHVYADTETFKDIEWDAAIEHIRSIPADIYINSNNSTEEIAEIKRKQIHSVLDIPDDHIVMNITGLKKSSITKKVIDEDTYILVDDSLHNIEMSTAVYNIVIKRPWNQHSPIPVDKNIIFVDDLYDAIATVNSILAAIPGESEKWEAELTELLKHGCSDSDIEDFANGHPGVDGRSIWNYVYEYNAPAKCKGCDNIQLKGTFPCTKCSRVNELKDYYKERQPENNGKYTLIQAITIPDEEMKLINDLLKLTGDEIYDKYGYKRDETITHTAKFPNGIEADIKLVICEDDTPYTEGVLFCNGSELTCTDPDDSYAGEWRFDYNGVEYIVLVNSEKSGVEIR